MIFYHKNLIKPSSITSSFNRQVNPKILQRQARHKRIETTLLYNQTTDEMVKEFYNKIQGKDYNNFCNDDVNIGYL